MFFLVVFYKCIVFPIFQSSCSLYTRFWYITVLQLIRWNLCITIAILPRNDKQRMERSQLPAAPHVGLHESGSPWTTPTDMRNQGIPQPQRTMLMYPLRRTVQHVSHYKVHKKDVDTILLCRWYKLSMVYNLYCTLCV